MNINRKNFQILVIVLSALAVVLLPFWPWARWGYFPSGLLIVLVAFMFMLQRLARD